MKKLFSISFILFASLCAVAQTKKSSSAAQTPYEADTLTEVINLTNKESKLLVQYEKDIAELMKPIQVKRELQKQLIELVCDRNQINPEKVTKLQYEQGKLIITKRK